MCGRYYLDSALVDGALREAVSALEKRTGETVRTGEMRPGDKLLVFARSRSGKTAPFLMKWGYRHMSGKLIINARGETAAKSPMFADGMARRRCLIPATAYFEWERRAEGKVKQQIAPADAGRFYIAGLYRFEDDQPVCVVLTREPAPAVRHIHDRMPALLAEEAARSWLDDRCDAQATLAGALDDMAFHEAPESGEA